MKRIIGLLFIECLSLVAVKAKQTRKKEETTFYQLLPKI